MMLTFMHKQQARLLAGSAVGLLTILSGCGVSPLTKRVTSFSTAATATTVSMQNAYQVVEDSYAQAQTAHLVNSFDTKGFNQDSVKKFLSDDDMKARTAMLNGLNEYAQKLAEVSGNDAVAQLDKNAEGMGSTLQSISRQSSVAEIAKNADVAAGAATAALDALGRALMEKKTAKELPGILKEMKDPVDQICALLEADMGTPATSGLRHMLRDDYDQLVADQRTYIYANEKSMSPQEKREEIEKLPQLVLARDQADLALVKTQQALKQLATTHDALVETRTSKDAPAFKATLADLVAQGQQLGDVYSAVETKLAASEKKAQ